MDLENKALIEAFEEKYGSSELSKKAGITDAEREESKRRFAEKWYALQEGRKPPTVELKNTTTAKPVQATVAAPAESNVYKEFSKGWRKQFGFEDK